jgi:hypothetical protein
MVGNKSITLAQLDARARFRNEDCCANLGDFLALLCVSLPRVLFSGARWCWWVLGKHRGFRVGCPNANGADEEVRLLRPQFVASLEFRRHGRQES